MLWYAKDDSGCLELSVEKSGDEVGTVGLMSSSKCP